MFARRQVVAGCVAGHRGAVRPAAGDSHSSSSSTTIPVRATNLTGNNFDSFGTVESASWVLSDIRRRGIGSKMRAAILHLAFEGLGAAGGHSEGAVDDVGSNAVSERPGYERNGLAWATPPGQAGARDSGRPAHDRDAWELKRRRQVTSR